MHYVCEWQAGIAAWAKFKWTKCPLPLARRSEESCFKPTELVFFLRVTEPE